MSHFSLLVITPGPDRPTDDELNRIMQPFHEYECTGVEDEYVVDVDVTDRVKADFDKYKEEGESFTAAWAKGWCGAEERGGRFYERTNPNKKWDFWMIGGRWTGTLSPGYDPAKDPRNQETCSLCDGTGHRDDAIGIAARGEDPSYTCNGCSGKGTRTKWPTKWTKHQGDQIRVGELDFDALQSAAEEEEAAHQYDKATAVIAGRPFDTWTTCLRLHGGDAKKARDSYWKQEVVKDFNKKFPFMNIADFAIPREEYLARARQSAVSTFAVLRDGKWYERGEMGWWGVVHDDKGKDRWNAEFEKLIRDLPKDSWLTVVDCHI